MCDRQGGAGTWGQQVIGALPYIAFLTQFGSILREVLLFYLCLLPVLVAVHHDIRVHVVVFLFNASRTRT